MAQEITVQQLKEAIAQKQEAISGLLYELQQETGITVTGVHILPNHNEVARDQRLAIKIVYEL